jgi:hypothetical protein
MTSSRDRNVTVKIQMPVSVKDKCLDALLLCMVLISLSGLIYSLLH